MQTVHQELSKTCRRKGKCFLHQRCSCLGKRLLYFDSSARDSKTKDLVKSFPQSFDKNYLYMFCMEKARYKFLIINYYYFLV